MDKCMTFLKKTLKRPQKFFSSQTRSINASRRNSANQIEKSLPADQENNKDKTPREQDQEQQHPVSLQQEKKPEEKRQRAEQQQGPQEDERQTEQHQKQQSEANRGIVQQFAGTRQQDVGGPQPAAASQILSEAEESNRGTSASDKQKGAAADSEETTGVGQQQEQQHQLAEAALFSSHTSSNSASTLAREASSRSHKVSLFPHAAATSSAPLEEAMSIESMHSAGRLVSESRARSKAVEGERLAVSNVARKTSTGGTTVTVPFEHCGFPVEGKSLQQLTRERDELVKRLEKTAQFYTTRIERITDIYNRVLRRAEAAEEKKCRYAEKLADIVVDGVPRNIRSNSAPDASATIQASVRRLSQEVQFLRDEKKELEGRVAELVDRCQALQVALEAQVLAKPQRNQSRRLSILEEEEPAIMNGTASRDRLSDTSVTAKALSKRRSTYYHYPQYLFQQAEREEMQAREQAFPSRFESTYGYAKRLFDLAEQEEAKRQRERKQGEESMRPELSENFSKAFSDHKNLQHNAASASKSERPRRSQAQNSALEADSRVLGFDKCGTDGFIARDGNQRRQTDKRTPLGAPILEKSISDQGVERFLTQEDDDGDNSVLSTFSRRASRRLPPCPVPSPNDEQRQVTPLCCSRRTSKNELRLLKVCGCTVCRRCLKNALYSAKSDINNFVGTNSVTGVSEWRIHCPKCGVKQKETATMARA